MRRILRTAFLVVVGAVAAVLVVSAIAQWIPDEDAPAGEPLFSRGEERITVDVRNSGGVDGMARAATRHLRAAGFDVVNVGNGDNFDQDSTVVFDRVGSPRKARAVAEALGVGAVASEPDTALFVDVTVELGSDWAVPVAEGELEPESDAPGLLDRFRRLVGRWR